MWWLCEAGLQSIDRPRAPNLEERPRAYRSARRLAAGSGSSAAVGGWLPCPGIERRKDGSEVGHRCRYQVLPSAGVPSDHRRKREPDLAAPPLLVPRHRGEDPPRCQPSSLGRRGEADAVEARLDPLRVAPPKNAQPDGKPRLQPDPDRDGLSVPHAVAAACLEAMAERMAEVQENARSCFTLVPRDDSRLEARGAADGAHHGARAAVPELRRI